MVFVKKSLLPHISDLESAAQGTGIMGMMVGFCWSYICMSFLHLHLSVPRSITLPLTDPLTELSLSFSLPLSLSLFVLLPHPIHNLRTHTHTHTCIHISTCLPNLRCRATRVAWQFASASSTPQYASSILTWRPTMTQFSAGIRCCSEWFGFLFLLVYSLLMCTTCNVCRIIMKSVDVSTLVFQRTLLCLTMSKRYVHWRFW